MKNNLKKSELLISPELGIYSNLYKDIYFDKYNGIKETQHNFLKANNLASRFKKSNKFIISELGFGTGLSFLLTLKLWKETKKPNAKLIYISFESAPLTKIELNNIYKKVSGVKILFNQLIKKLPKAELHLHIEGSLEPKLMFDLATKNKITIPFKNIDEVKSAYNFHNLQSFLNIYCINLIKVKIQTLFVKYYP